MEVPRKGVKSEVQPPAYTRATATQNLSHVCDLHHSSQQRRILNPLSKARDQTHNLMVPSQIRFRLATTGTPIRVLLRTIFVADLGGKVTFSQVPMRGSSLYGTVVNESD